MLRLQMPMHQGLFLLMVHVLAVIACLLKTINCIMSIISLVLTEQQLVSAAT